MFLGRAGAVALAIALSLGTLATLATLAMPAAAQKPARDAAAEASRHADRGRKLYDLRRYDEAIREFDAAHRLSGDPSHLYNLAQAHRLAGHAEEALRHYQIYLDRVPDTPRRPEIERRMAELRQAVQAPGARPPPPEPAPVPPSVPAVPTVPAPPPVPVVPAVPAPPAAPVFAPLPPAPQATPPTEQPPPPPVVPGPPPQPAAPPPAAPIAPPAAPKPAPLPLPLPPPDPAALLPGYHAHEGFFLRMLMGGSLTGMTSNGPKKIEIDGVGIHLAAAAGWTLGGKVIAYGEFFLDQVQSPTVKVDGVEQSVQNPAAGLRGAGIGAAYYFVPRNVFVSLTAHMSEVDQQRGDRAGTRGLTTKWGPGATLTLGKEWWVASDWGAGLALQLHTSWAQESTTTVAGLDAATWHTTWYGLFLSATYD